MTAYNKKKMALFMVNPDPVLVTLGGWLEKSLWMKCQSQGLSNLTINVAATVHKP